MIINPNRSISSWDQGGTEAIAVASRSPSTQCCNRFGQGLVPVLCKLNDNRDEDGIGGSCLHHSRCMLQACVRRCTVWDGVASIKEEKSETCGHHSHLSPPLDLNKSK